MHAALVIRHDTVEMISPRHGRGHIVPVTIFPIHSVSHWSFPGAYIQVAPRGTIDYRC